MCRELYASEENPRKKFKAGGDPALEPIGETTTKPEKQPPHVQSAIYAAHLLSSAFNITHAINILLVGTWARFDVNAHMLKLPDRHFRSCHLDRSTKRH